MLVALEQTVLTSGQSDQTGACPCPWENQALLQVGMWKKGFRFTPAPSALEAGPHHGAHPMSFRVSGSEPLGPRGGSPLGALLEPRPGDKEAANHPIFPASLSAARPLQFPEYFLCLPPCLLASAVSSPDDPSPPWLPLKFLLFFPSEPWVALPPGRSLDNGW